MQASSFVVAPLCTSEQQRCGRLSREVMYSQALRMDIHTVAGAEKSCLTVHQEIPGYVLCDESL